jgi:GTPase involved in cell partitioning and DNA repair
MPTLYSSIFTKANILFEDAQLLANLTDEELTELLEIFLDKSKSIYFKNCKKDLTDVDNTLKQFNEDLTSEEEWILATGIRLVWLERKLYKEESLRDKLTTKDYNSSHSTANLIEKLTMLKNETEKNLKNLVVDYSFNEFEGFN